MKIMTQIKGIKIEKENQDLTEIAYADDIVLIVEIDNDFKNTANILKEKNWLENQ